MHDMVEAFQFYESHPVDFLAEVVGVTLDEWQEEALNKLVEKHFLAIRSGSGVGKTALMAFALLWFISTKPFSRVPTTAPSQHQLYDLLWAECYTWIKKCPFLDQLLHWTQTRISVRGYEPNWYAVARTATVSPSGDVAEGLQGFHSEDNLLFLVDETSGVPDQVFPAIDGALTNKNAYCMLASNPTRDRGYFYDVFNDVKLGSNYHKVHMSSEDSPRVEASWVQMMEERYGRDHPIFMIKVLGEFPPSSDELLIPPYYLEAMQNNSKDTVVSPAMPVEMGVDVGRTQHPSIVVVRQGYNILYIGDKHKPGTVTDTLDVVEWVVELMNVYKPTEVKIDAVGIGAGVADILIKTYPNRIIPVIGSAKAEDPDKYLNLRAQGYWALRDKIPKMWCKNWTPRLLVELGDIRQKYSKTGKLHVETKQEMLNRAMRSPDYADALMYAFLTEFDTEAFKEFEFSKKFSDVNASLVNESGWTKPVSRSRWLL